MRAVVVAAHLQRGTRTSPRSSSACWPLDPPLDVLVVDDASPDGTADIAEGARRDRACASLRREAPRGYAGSCRDGMRQGAWRTATTSW